MLCCLIPAGAFAQVKLGVKGGAGIAGIHQPPSHFGNEHRLGYHAGLFTQVTRYKSKFFIRPELLYSVRGFYMKTAGLRRLVGLTYFSIPIMFGFKPGKRLSLLAGAEPGFITAIASQTPNNYRTNDIAINVGLAYDITYNLGIELRGGVGLFSLMQVQEVDEAGQQLGVRKAGYNNALQICISYNFAQEGVSNIAPVLRRKKP